MKILRGLLLILGVLIIVFGIINLINTSIPNNSETAYIIGLFIGKGFFLLIGVALVIIANDMKKKADKKKKSNALINSLPGK